MERQQWFDDNYLASSSTSAAAAATPPIVFVNMGKEYWPALLLREGRPNSIVKYTDGGHSSSFSMRDIETVPTVDIVREIPKKRNVGKPKTFLEEQEKEVSSSSSPRSSKKKKKKKRKIASPQKPCISSFSPGKHKQKYNVQKTLWDDDDDHYHDDDVLLEEKEEENQHFSTARAAATTTPRRRSCEPKQGPRGNVDASTDQEFCSDNELGTKTHNNNNKKRTRHASLPTAPRSPSIYPTYNDSSSSSSSSSQKSECSGLELEKTSRRVRNVAPKRARRSPARYGDFKNTLEASKNTLLTTSSSGWEEQELPTLPFAEKKKKKSDSPTLAQAGKNEDDDDDDNDDSSIEFLYTLPAEKKPPPPPQQTPLQSIKTDQLVGNDSNLPVYVDSSDDEVYANNDFTGSPLSPPLPINGPSSNVNKNYCSRKPFCTPSVECNSNKLDVGDKKTDVVAKDAIATVTAGSTIMSSSGEESLQHSHDDPFSAAAMQFHRESARQYSIEQQQQQAQAHNEKESTSDSSNSSENPQFLLTEEYHSDLPFTRSDDSTHEELQGESQLSYKINNFAVVSNTTKENSQTSSIISNQQHSPPPPPSISFGSSAYLQNLAEICYIILNDLRWRVGPHNQPLFRWEHGDDLSVVAELSRCFRAPPAKPPQRTALCRCLLCRDQKQRSETNDESASNLVQQRQDNVSADRLSQYDLEDEEITRPLHLYCRLFYRKGPWFRIDDVYKRYYAPNLSKGSELSTEEAGRPQDSISSDSNNNDHHTCQSTTTDKLSTEQHLEFHKNCLKQLLVDLFQLKSTGRLRSFIGEEECGKTVGVTLLSSDERSAILSKLGGGKSKAKAVRRKGSNVSVSSNSSCPDNAIWKQMSQQQSLLNHFKPGCGTKVLLPVQRHVDELLLTKLVIVAVDSVCRHMKQVPSNSRKEIREDLMRYVRETVKQILPDEFSVGITCFRLREAPLRTLQRCSRLFLCSTSGPGSMRGSGDHGWLSLQELEINANLPFQNAVPPSGAMWHKVVYPGLTYRFGLSSAPFFSSYLPISATEPGVDGGDQDLKRVFVSYQAFRAWEMAVELRANVDYLVELCSSFRYKQKMWAKDSAVSEPENCLAVFDSLDLLGILTTEGQDTIFSAMCRAMAVSDVPAELKRAIEEDIVKCESSLDSEYDKILGAIGALALGVLYLRNQVLPDNELLLLARRPWLRHLCWEGCLAYVLWDIIPIYEKNGMHQLATRSLQVLVFGNAVDTLEELTLLEPTRLAPFLLSRRARGKAIDRLVIDFTHLRRQELKDENNATQEDKQGMAKKTAAFCEKLIEMYAQSGGVPFSAVRGIAKRLKRPLSISISESCTECKELGLRLHNEEEKSQLTKQKYCDWNPPTDFAVANALVNEQNKEGSGGRCAFVGFEDTEVTTSRHSSLNVEELAMEFYNAGHLPSEACSAKGGCWCGWHDEGMHIRALFRILCSCPILGVDWGCANDLTDKDEIESRTTIHLSPYQGAPFDLHVGHSIDATIPCHSFYNRRRKRIDQFLKKLEELSPQDLSDLVFDSVVDRAQWMVSNSLKDPSIGSDLLQVRALSAVAAGCGGKQLASAFRLLCYDYRHYSGGLPDLTLFRARRIQNVNGDSSSSSDTSQFVAPGDWIGESFSPEFQQQIEFHRGVAMLSDKDEEFLGCSKVGDSGRSNNNRKQTNAPAKPPAEIPSIDELQKLDLSHDGSALEVECLLVEVKSHNDRLDPRQEDWLNILDLHGNARVCKFKATTMTTTTTSEKRKNTARMIAKKITTTTTAL